MLTNPQTVFCNAQCHGYLFRIVFPSPGILKHYTKFDIHTIATLEKSFSAGSFGGSIGHLARRQTTPPTSLDKFDLPSTVQTIAPTFLGCWALIAPTLVTHF